MASLPAGVIQFRGTRRSAPATVSRGTVDDSPVAVRAIMTPDSPRSATCTASNPQR